MNPVTLATLITRVRQRYGGEGATQTITDLEISDHLNVSLANELYDLVRQSVGDQYYRRTYQFTTQQSVNSYDLPADFLALVSVDVWLTQPTVPGANALKINARRYMEYERNYYQQILLGWSAGASALYTLNAQQITFQPTPVSAVYIGINYVPVSPQLGGGADPTDPSKPASPHDTWDDVNGWSEIAVLDAAAKCCLKLGRLDMVQALQLRNQMMAKKIAGLIQLRHEGEPERVNMPYQPAWGDGWRE